MARDDIERHRRADPDQARGELPALCVSSPTIRRLALETRDQQAEAVAAAITVTCPAVHPAVARAHAAAIVSVFQMIDHHIGRGVLAGTPPDTVSDDLAPAVEVVLDHHFLHIHRQHAHGPRSAS